MLEENYFLWGEGYLTLLTLDEDKSGIFLRLYCLNHNALSVLMII